MNPGLSPGGIHAWAWALPRLRAQDVGIASHKLGRPIESEFGLRGWSRNLVVLGGQQQLRHRKGSLDENLAAGAWPGDASHATGDGQLRFTRRAKENDVICNDDIRLSSLAEIWHPVNPLENLNNQPSSIRSSHPIDYDSSPIGTK